MSVFLSPDRCFHPEPTRRAIARRLYAEVAALPLLCPHGHVDPAIFADPDYSFGTPADLFIIPDHYVFRMLYSQGIPVERLGVPRQDGGATETNRRAIWQTFAEHVRLFDGTPTGLWLKQELAELFGIDEPLNGDSAQRIYDSISAQLATDAFRPRALYERFRIEALSTTDAAADPLQQHQAIRASGWQGRILPTFRPDAAANLDTPNWIQNLHQLSEATGADIGNYRQFIAALEDRRAYFKSLGATATDHAARTADTQPLEPAEAEAIFDRALKGALLPEDAPRFTAHLLTEMARMSVEDGLTMQLHIGSYRSHNPTVFAQFGADKGADIPLPTEYTRPLKPLLDRFGNDSRLTLILFTLDESAYSRDLAPLAGHYPALRLGPPWWFYDSRNGMRRFLDSVVETAGIYNLVGFNDDTRAFCSIPARHDVWRRVVCDWLAGQVAEEILEEEAALTMAQELSYGLAKRAYRL